ncbi:MAG: HAMP domain-containing histidine kinase [Lachnospiraceae bacterium]|nr:HAMP domain-containing histidine kinase [Lachnospiraceae bacterium]
MEKIIYITVLAIALSVVLILIIRLVMMKKQTKSMIEQLEYTKDFSYNKQIQIELIDRDLTDLATAFNKNLDFQKSLKLKHEKTEKQLKQSISDIAHDLRTPLTVIKGNLQLLAQGKGLTESQQEYIKICTDKADLLRQMIDDFFEISVLESDTDEIPIKSVNATNLLMQFILDHEALIREKELTPDIHLPEKTVMLKGDEAFILRMLSNLLNNILKYGKNEFEVGLSEGNDNVVIYFANEVLKGTDIDIDRLFDRTYRADGARKEGSAGLGLYIVKVLAEKQGGSVRARLDDKKLFIELEFKK